jgi:hypothetical protein
MRALKFSQSIFLSQPKVAGQLDIFEKEKSLDIN